MLLSRIRRLRGNTVILACIFTSFIAYYKYLNILDVSGITRESHHYFNHTKELFLPGHPQQIPPARTNIQQLCSEPSYPLQSTWESHPSLTNTTAAIPSHTCACVSSPTPSSTTIRPSPEKFVKEQETIASLRAQGIVIIFKTGAQEVSQLSIHLGTTLRFFSPSDIVFFSDLQGFIGPFPIHDALQNVDQALIEVNEDFEIYRKIHEYQSTGQDIRDLTEDRGLGDGRGGWRLDKYKFIHMVEETFELRPDARWYVFIETDSYIVWPNLVAWLEKLDSKKPWYLGSVVYTGEHSFAHGGSGYVLSNAAMNKLLGPDQPQGLARSWDSRMTSLCCGDVALGIALEEKGIKLTGARPFLNGYKPSTFTYGEHWCQPVVAMHHMTSHEINGMWRFERKREVMGNENATTFSELFEQFVEPQLGEEKDNWDNLSHGQEFTEPEWWTLNSEEEDRKREGEERAAERARIREKQQLDAKMRQETEVEDGDKTRDGQDISPSDDSKGDSEADTKETEGIKSQEEEEHPNLEPGLHDDEDNIKESTSEVDSALSHLKAKRLMKRQDSEAEADPELNMHPKWRPFSPQKEAFKSFADCRMACAADDECFQFVYYGRTCKLSTSFRLGMYKAPEMGVVDEERGTRRNITFKSGWMMDRIRSWIESNPCLEAQWPVFG